MSIQDRPSIAQSESLLAVLAQDEHNGRIVANLVDVSMFEGDYRLVAERFVAYWREHDRPPGVHTSDLFADIFEASNSRKAAQLQRMLIGLLGLSENLNTEYVMEELRVFSRVQALKAAVVGGAKALGQNARAGIEEVERIFAEVMRAHHLQFDAGLRLDDDLDAVLDYLDKRGNEFISGIKPMDQAGIVPARGTLLLFIAGKGRGKTWFLINCAKLALLLRKKVLHISLENSALETRVRYYQAMYAIPQRRAEEHAYVVRFMRSAGRNRLEGFERERMVEPEFALNSGDVRAELETRIRMMPYIGNLLIKRFPNRSLSVEGLEGYLDALEQIEGFVPDLVCLDYAKLMKLSGNSAQDRRVSIGDTIERLRGLAVERNFALVTADQLNREGYKSKQARSIHVAEDWSEIHTADKVLMHSATDAERRRGLCRIYVEHARSEQDKFAVVLSQNFAIGQFCLDSIRMVDGYTDMLAGAEQQWQREDADARADGAGYVTSESEDASPSEEES